MRDRKAVARYAGLTGSRTRVREARNKARQEPAMPGSRRGMIQPPGAFCGSEQSALALWIQARTAIAVPARARR